MNYTHILFQKTIRNDKRKKTLDKQKQNQCMYVQENHYESTIYLRTKKIMIHETAAKHSPKVVNSSEQRLFNVSENKYF